MGGYEDLLCLYSDELQQDCFIYWCYQRDMERCLREHALEAKKQTKHFCGRYQVYYLIYYERYGIVTQAIQREKEIKNMARAKKEEIINRVNPNWDFFNDDFLR